MSEPAIPHVANVFSDEIYYGKWPGLDGEVFVVSAVNDEAARLISSQYEKIYVESSRTGVRVGFERSLAMTWTSDQGERFYGEYKSMAGSASLPTYWLYVGVEK